MPKIQISFIIMFIGIFIVIFAFGYEAFIWNTIVGIICIGFGLMVTSALYNILFEEGKEYGN